MKETLAKAAANFLSELSLEEREGYRQGVNNFVRWCGADRVIGGLSALDVANYAESINSSSVDIAKVTTPVRAFLLFAKKEGLTITNLSIHLKVKKSVPRKGGSGKGKPEISTMTHEGYEELKAELVALKKERPKLVEDIHKAAADKDFRENAPLEAARERQGMVEARIRQIEAMLKTTVVGVEDRPSDQSVALGSKVVILDLSDNEELTYTLVNKNEASPLKGKLSVASPIGKTLIGHKEDDVVDVAAPAGVMRYRIVRIVD